MCPSKYNCFWDTARYLWKNQSFFHTPLHLTPPLGGSRRNIGIPFGMKKLEWCRCLTVKKFRRYVYSFWPDPRTWQTDGRTLRDSIDRACIASHGKKCYGGSDADTGQGQIWMNYISAVNMQNYCDILTVGLLVWVCHSSSINIHNVFDPPYIFSWCYVADAHGLIGRSLEAHWKWLAASHYGVVVRVG